MFQIASSAVEHGAAAAEHSAEHGLGVVPVHYLYQIGGVTVHLDTIMTTWLAMAVAIVLALMVTKMLKRKPNGKQTIAEALVEFVEGFVRGMVGEKDALRCIPLIGSIFVFVLCCNLTGLIPWRLLHLSGIMPVSSLTGHELEIAAPTNDLNTTVGLALISVISYFYFGIRKKGLPYFKHYILPHPLFFFFNILEDFTRPLSLSFRLFGNILGGEILIGILLLLVPWFIPLPIFAFEVFVALIQAFIFSVLTASYIGSSLKDHDHHNEHEAKAH